MAENENTISARVGRVEQELNELRGEMRAGFDKLQQVLLGDYTAGGYRERLVALEKEADICRQWRLKHEDEASAIVKAYDERLGTVERELREEKARAVEREKDLVRAREKAEYAERWIADRNAQWRLLLLLGGGNVLGLLYVLYQLAQLANAH